MGCKEGTMKCILHTLNVLMALGSIGIIAFNIMGLKDTPGPIPSTAYYFFISGGIGLIATIIGCCGICRENAMLTSLYAIFIGISFVIQIVTTFFIDTSESVRERADYVLSVQWRSQNGLAPIEMQYKCCGKNSPLDYGLEGRSIPQSCYDYMHNLYKTGCIDALVTASKDSVVTITTLIITGIMFIFAICLVIRFRNKQRHYNY